MAILERLRAIAHGLTKLLYFSSLACLWSPWHPGLWRRAELVLIRNLPDKDVASGIDMDVPYSKEIPAF